MLFVATHTHNATRCPLQSPEGKTMIKKLFSDDNVKKSGLKIVAAYMSCPKDKSSEHKGYFIIDADSAPTVSKFFGARAILLTETLFVAFCTATFSLTINDLAKYLFVRTETRG